MITVCIYCHMFEKRLCMMLSSLLDQSERPVIDVRSFPGGTPGAAETVAFFSGLGLNIVHHEYNDITVFEQRGIVRNHQIEDCSTDWLLFTDSDMVYSPKFFEKLNKVTESTPRDTMLRSGRMSTNDVRINRINKIVDNCVQDRPAYVPDAFGKVDPFARVLRASVGAGFFQLCHVDATDGFYVEGMVDAGWASGEAWRTKSDLSFRKKFQNKQDVSPWFWRNQLHVNHWRDNQYGHHLEVQR